MNARHDLWGDSKCNNYGIELVKQLDFQDYTIAASKKPTFLSLNGNSFIDLQISTIASADAFSSLTSDEEIELFSGHVPILTCLSTSFDKKALPPPKTCLDLNTMDWESWSTKSESYIAEKSTNWNNLAVMEKWELLNH